jgi:hypothetical protein
MIHGVGSAFLQRQFQRWHGAIAVKNKNIGHVHRVVPPSKRCRHLNGVAQEVNRDNGNGRSVITLYKLYIPNLIHGVENVSYADGPLQRLRFSW